MVVVETGGGGRLLTSSCLCRLYLIGLSFGILQIRPPFDREEGLSNNVLAWKPEGGLFRHLPFASIHQLTGKRRDTLLVHSYMQSYNLLLFFLTGLPYGRHSLIEMQLLQ